MGLFTKRTYVGVDLGTHALKAVQVEKSGNMWRISHAAVAPTPPDCIRDGVVSDQDSLSAALKQMLKNGGISATNAHIAAAGASVFVRVVPFPKMAEAVLRKSIKYEASRYVPGSVEDSYIEFEIIGPINDTQMNVLIVAAPKDIVESRIRACEAAGLEVESVDIEVFAAYRSLIETSPNYDISDSTIALVDIGASSTSVSVINKGVFSMNRAIPSGGRSLTDELKKRFNLEDEDAEEGKAQLDVRGFLPSTGIEETPPLRVIQPQLEDMVREIRRSMNYFQSQQAESGEGSVVDKIVLTGGGAKLTGLSEYLTQRLSMPVESPGVFSNSRILPPEADFGAGEDLAVASGLALRSYGKAL
jgi:type IV pilus assembly protein PilM